MSSLSIDKNLDPNKEVTIKIDMSFFGYGKEMEFTFITPNAAPLLSRIDTIRLKNEKGPEKEKTKGSYTFTKYAKGVDINKDFYKLKLYLTNAKQANQLEPGETINFVASNPSGPLAALHNKNFQIIKDTNKDPKYIYLRVQKTFQPTTPQGSANGTLQEITGTIKTRKYTITVPENVIKGLIAEKLPTVKDGMMEDIVIFAYKRFKGGNSADVKKKLMLNNNDVNEKEPPARSDILEYRGKKSYSKTFEINDKENFLFYIAIARYTYNGTGWTKEWVQTNSLDQAIWGKATEGEKK